MVRLRAGKGWVDESMAGPRPAWAWLQTVCLLGTVDIYEQFRP